MVDAVARHGAGHPKSCATQESGSHTEPQHFLRHPLLLWLPLAMAPSKVGAIAGPVAWRLKNIYGAGHGIFPHLRTKLFSAKKVASKAFLWL